MSPEHEMKGKTGAVEVNRDNQRRTKEEVGNELGE